MNKFFYGVYLEDSTCQSVFDLIAILANPFTERRSKSHITLRGPYDKQMTELPTLKAKNADIKGIEKFATPRGCATVLILDIEGVQEIWHKPDYPDGLPHLTLYEGEDEEFASKLSAILSGISLSFSVGISPMQLVNNKFLPAQEFENYEEIKDIYKVFVNPEWKGFGHIKKLSSVKRINTIEQVLKKSLSRQHYQPRQKNSIFDDDKAYAFQGLDVVRASHRSDQLHLPLDMLN